MSNTSSKKSRLLAILKKKSVFHGEFVLSSGARSSHYFDCKLSTLDPEACWLVGEVFNELISQESMQSGVHIDSIGGLTMGADPISLATGMVSFQLAPENPLRVFIVRKTPKTHGQNKLVEGNFSKGDNVVVIDDVITRGDSTLKAIEVIQAEGGKVQFVVVLVDREEGGRQKIEAKGIPVKSIFRKSEILESNPSSNNRSVQQKIREDETVTA